MELLELIWGYKENELVNLSKDELVLLFFEIRAEVNNPHIKCDGVNPYGMKMQYIKYYQEKCNRILQLLKSKGQNINYFCLRYRQIQIKVKKCFAKLLKDEID